MAEAPLPITDWQSNARNLRLLCKACILVVAALWTGAAMAQSLTGGADLFAPSATAGKAADADRALPITPFYRSAGAKSPAEPGTLVRSEPTTDFALPPGITAT